MKKETKKWAERELGSADLGDKRLPKRLIEVAESFSDSPEASIPKATINWNSAKGAYRFFDNPKVTGEKILKAHGESSEKRVAEHAKSCVIILFLLYAGRQMPDLPASILFEDSECKALYSYTHQTPNPPPNPLTLQDMTSYLAKLGGFLGRKDPFG